MTRTAKTLTVIALISALGAGAGVAAASGKANAYNLPNEVKSSSIQVKENAREEQASFLKLAKITQQQAEAAALKVQPGKVVKAKLDDEDGYLVWQIDIKHGKGTTEFAVDPGNGQVLAAEAEDDDDHERG